MTRAPSIKIVFALAHSARQNLPQAGVDAKRAREIVREELLAAVQGNADSGGNLRYDPDLGKLSFAVGVPSDGTSIASSRVGWSEDQDITAAKILAARNMGNSGVATVPVFETQDGSTRAYMFIAVPMAAGFPYSITFGGLDRRSSFVEIAESVDVNGADFLVTRMRRALTITTWVGTRIQILYR